MKTQRGFTLIELLVVIAVISVLSAIVLASLSTTRGRAADAAVKANLNTVMKQTALIYDDNNGSYGGTTLGWANCPTLLGGTTLFHEPKIFEAINEAKSKGGGTAKCTVFPSYYVVEVRLKTSGYWCIDSRGISKSHPTSQTGSPTTCP